MTNYRLIAAAVAALLVGCGDTGSDNAPAGAPASPPAAQAAPAANAGAVDAGTDVRLTRDRFERWVAAIEELGRVARTTSPEVAEAIGVNADESVEDAVARMRRYPAITDALRTHGFTPESYVGFMTNMIYAMGAHMAREGGHDVPSTYPVNEQDVRFIAENQEWVQEQWSRLGDME